MYKISPLTDKTWADFERLFKDYYTELGCEDDCEHLLKEYILPDVTAGLVKIDLLETTSPCGFVAYQTDEIGNDWNYKEGWGDVREIYVSPDLRGQGLGRFLLYTAEMKLRESGATRAYALPTQNSVKFFEVCGYKPSGEYSEELDCPEYIKERLVNGCKA